jgi:hypothetical protein
MITRRSIRAAGKIRRAAYAFLAMFAVIVQSFGPLAAAEAVRTDFAADIVICTAEGLRVVPAGFIPEDGDQAPGEIANHCAFGVCNHCCTSFSTSATAEFHAFATETGFHSWLRDDLLAQSAEISLFHPRAPPTA